MSQLILDLDKLKQNIEFLARHCRSRGLGITGVVKGPVPDDRISREMLAHGFENIGISRVPDGPRRESIFAKRPIYISLPSLHELGAVVQYFDQSFNSQLPVIEKLNHAAIAMDCPHDILLMVDTGDMREGVMPDEVVDTVRKIHEIKHLRLGFAGIGTNLGCCAGRVPDEANIFLLAELARAIETDLGIAVNTVSVGGSVFLEWLGTRPLPGEINNIRLGESVFLGTIPTFNKKHDRLHDDAVMFRTDVLETSVKEVTPPKTCGKNALGGTPEFTHTGKRKRAILNFGICDTHPPGLTPASPGMEIVCINSNYTVVDFTDCESPLKTGDFVDFKMNYQALFQSVVSPFTRIHYLGQPNREK